MLASLGNGIDMIVRLLLQRFKKPFNVVMNVMIHERYIMRDAVSRREPREYAQKIIRSAKDAGLDSIQNLLDIIYNGIDLDLRRDIKRPRNPDLNAFLSELDESKYE